MFVRFIWFILSMYLVVQVFYFLVDFLPSYFIEVPLKSSTIVTELSISLFNSVSFCFMYFRALWLGIHLYL